MAVQWHQRAWNALLTIALLLSIGYSSMWLMSSSWILELSCINHTAVVHAEAIQSRQAGDWRRAAHLYAYLREFGPHSERGCRAQEATATSWLLPMSALAWQWRFWRLDKHQDRIQTADEAEFNNAYAAAARHLGWSIETDTRGAR